MNLKTLNGLLTSRKFWLATIALVGAVVLYTQNAITAEQLTNAIVTLMSILVGTIAIEDVATKISKKDN